MSKRDLQEKYEELKSTKIRLETGINNLESELAPLLEKENNDDLSSTQKLTIQSLKSDLTTRQNTLKNIVEQTEKTKQQLAELGVDVGSKDFETSNSNEVKNEDNNVNIEPTNEVAAIKEGKIKDNNNEGSNEDNTEGKSEDNDTAMEISLGSNDEDELEISLETSYEPTTNVVEPNENIKDDKPEISTINANNNFSEGSTKDTSKEHAVESPDITKSSQKLDPDSNSVGPSEDDEPTLTAEEYVKSLGPEKLAEITGRDLPKNIFHADKVEFNIIFDENDSSRIAEEIDNIISDSKVYAKLDITEDNNHNSSVIDNLIYEYPWLFYNLPNDWSEIDIRNKHKVHKPWTIKKSQQDESTINYNFKSELGTNITGSLSINENIAKFKFDKAPTAIEEMFLLDFLSTTYPTISISGLEDYPDKALQYYYYLTLKKCLVNFDETTIDSISKDINKYRLFLNIKTILTIADLGNPKLLINMQNNALKSWKALGLQKTAS